MPIAVIIMMVLFVASVLSGMLLVALSRRGWVDHPACGRCDYDLTGVWRDSNRCPECGGAFAVVGISPPGSRVDRRRLLAGLSLVLLPIVIALAAGLDDLLRYSRRSNNAPATIMFVPTTAPAIAPTTAVTPPTPAMLGEPEP